MGVGEERKLRDALHGNYHEWVYSYTKNDHNYFSCNKCGWEACLTTTHYCDEQSVPDCHKVREEKVSKKHRQVVLMEELRGKIVSVEGEDGWHLSGVLSDEGLVVYGVGQDYDGAYLSATEMLRWLGESRESHKKGQEDK